MQGDYTLYEGIVKPWGERERKDRKGRERRERNGEEKRGKGEKEDK